MNVTHFFDDVVGVSGIKFVVAVVLFGGGAAAAGVDVVTSIGEHCLTQDFSFDCADESLLLLFSRVKFSVTNE